MTWRTRLSPHRLAPTQRIRRLVTPACANTGTITCDWSLKGADAEDFNIGNQNLGTPGELTFKEIPNYEMPADANRDNMYMVTVVVTDKTA